MLHKVREYLLPIIIRKLFLKLDSLFALPALKADIQTELFPEFTSSQAVLYVHFPFCESACRYCPFSKTLNQKEARKYCSALLSEIRLFKEKINGNVPPLSALFFGGGTPSLIPIDSLSQLLCTIQKEFGEIPQITLECNPESLNREKLKIYKELGINRLTIGAQSFHEEILQELGRIHSPQLIVDAVSMAREAGFSNISIDLIYGFNNQSLDEFLADIEKAIALPINHISLFPLINSNRKERQALPSSLFAKQLRFYKKAKAMLEASGFYASSVEDFTKEPQGENRYQKAVWELPHQDMIILGTSGFGMAGAYNYSKVKKIDTYIKEIDRGNIPLSDCFRGSEKSLNLRRFLMGLHYNSISNKEFQTHYKVTPFRKYRLIILALRLLGLAKKEDDTLKLTESGRFVTSLIWAKIMLSRMSQ